MNISTEALNEFLAMASRQSTWENARPGMWVRSSKTNGWAETEITDDPYTTLPIAIDITPEGDGDSEAIMLMYGWASRIDDGTGEDMEDDRIRVRFIMYFHDGDQSVAVQFQGKTVDTFEDIGDGMFPETLQRLREAQRSGEL